MFTLSAIKANASSETGMGRLALLGEGGGQRVKGKGVVGGVVQPTGGWGRFGWGYEGAGGGGGNIGRVEGGRGGGLLMESHVDSYIKQGAGHNRGLVNDIRTADPGH